MSRPRSVNQHQLCIENVAYDSLAVAHTHRAHTCVCVCDLYRVTVQRAADALGGNWACKQHVRYALYLDVLLTITLVPVAHNSSGKTLVNTCI